MPDLQDEKPISLEAWETLAESFAALVDTKPENADLERPATLSLLPDVAGLRVLDAGCGPGRYAEWLVERGAQVVAFDASPKMVALARQRLGDRARVQQTDLAKPLDFLEDESFNLVVSLLVLDYVRDWESVFAEFRRLLRPEGLLVFSTGHPFAEFKLRDSEDYFATELTEMVWRGFGVQVVMPSYRRPLGAIFNALAETDFVIEKLVEARPTEEFKRKDPEGYEQLSRRPSFLCFRARKDANSQS